MEYFVVKGIKKTWETVTVDFELECKKGELVCLLGKSGSGKSTVLNIIAGLEQNDKDFLEKLEIWLDGKRIEKLKPRNREIGMVFQSGALFNHLNVVQNVSYGLISKGMKKSLAYKKSSEFLNLVELSGFENRFIQTLSGGEKQRVALARTLICEPKLILLDEPFSALDTDLRISLCQKLKDLQQKIKFTAIMVTHDQTEAKTVADKIIKIGEKD